MQPLFIEQAPPRSIDICDLTIYFEIPCVENSAAPLFSWGAVPQNPTGMKKLSRRQIILGLGAAGTGAVLSPLLSSAPEAAAISPAAYPSCTVSPEQSEGPFYFDAKLIRKDITEGRPGTVLHLKLKVVEGEECDPVRDAVVDVWSCDARGEYSGYETVYTAEGRVRGQRGLPFDREKHSDDGRPPFHEEPNNDETFMRGAQVTDAKGEVEFKTIYPGWYPGRATHIHVKVYLNDDEVFTSQMYFPEEVNEAVYSGEVYAGKEGERKRNEEDGIFSSSEGSPMVAVTRVEDGYVGTLTFGIRRA